MADWSFISHITDYLARPRHGDEKQPTQWPSEASATILNEHGEPEVVGKCRRQAYFRLLLDSYAYSPKYKAWENLVEEIKAKSTDPDVYLRWIWKQGELYEDYCVDLAKEAGVFISGQTAVYLPEYNVSGKVDLIVIDPETQDLRIVEVKSVYGYNANSVLGTPAERKRGLLGTPREAHLMQIGIYQFWYAGRREGFGSGLLLYGARDTGRFAEYAITIEKDEIAEGQEEHFIFYQGVSPNKTAKVNSGLSIENILSNYKMIARCVDSGEIPARDYELRFDETKITKLYERGELSKKDTEQYEKRKKQVEEGKTRLVKAVEKGDWQCRLCSYREVCYDNSNEPREL